MRASSDRVKGEPSSPAPRERRGRLAGSAVVAILTLVTGLHVYWALGGDWAAATAYGSRDLPPRAAVWIVVVLLLAAIVIVLGRMGAWGGTLSNRVFRIATWGLVVVFVVVSLQNFASGLSEETYGREWALFLIAPLLLVLAWLCAIVARSGADR